MGDAVRRIGGGDREENFFFLGPSSSVATEKEYMSKKNVPNRFCFERDNREKGGETQSQKAEDISPKNPASLCIRLIFWCSNPLYTCLFFSFSIRLFSPPLKLPMVSLNIFSPFMSSR